MTRSTPPPAPPAAATASAVTTARLGEYHAVFCYTLSLCAELARLTGNTWDDAAVAAVSDLYHKLFGPQPAAAPGSVMGVEAVVAGSGVPPWLVDALTALFRRLLGL
jgi:hypothetical protein